MTRSALIHVYLLDPLERSGSTFVQQFAVILLASGGGLLVTQNWAVAADTAGFAAILSLVMSVASILGKVPSLSAPLDFALRIAKTFVQSLLGTVSADQFTHSVVHGGWLGALAIAFNVSLLAFFKGAAALSFPWSLGASVLPLPVSVHQVNAANLLAKYGYKIGYVATAHGAVPVPVDKPAPTVVEAPALKVSTPEVPETPRHAES